MNISKHEQRTLHALAQGGAIHQRKNEKGDIVEIDCLNRDGWRLDERITREGLTAVRSQLDNR